jgi:hypothetical protein
MKQPTVEELEKLINDYNWQGDSALVFAEQIHAIYNPPLKPLSELLTNEEACREIWRKVHPDAELDNIQIWDGCVDMDGEDEGGSVTLVLNSNTCQLSDIIRDLGYDVQPETKTT